MDSSKNSWAFLSKVDTLAYTSTYHAQSCSTVRRRQWLQLLLLSFRSFAVADPELQNRSRNHHADGQGMENMHENLNLRFDSRDQGYASIRDKIRNRSDFFVVVEMSNYKKVNNIGLTLLPRVVRHKIRK